MRAFWELSSERQFGQVIGPIPWSSVVAYGSLHNLDDTMMPVFTRLMRDLDEAYLQWQRDEQKRRTDR